MGYDPIFKAQPGPAAIQPAPSSAPSMQPTSATASPYPPPPQGYMPAVTQPYAPSLTAGAASPGSSVEPYDYTAAIDPALEGAGASSQMQVSSSLYDGSHENRLGGMLHANPFLSTTYHLYEFPTSPSLTAPHTSTLENIKLIKSLLPRSKTN